MAILGRDFSNDGLVKHRNRSSKVLVLAATIIAVLVLGAIAGSIGHSAKGRTPIGACTLTPHDPILIDGNAGFTGLNSSTGVTRGSGTIDDPYVIEGWEISSFPESGIEIRNSGVYFVIQDCYVHNGAGWGGAAIHLWFCCNGTIRNNVCFTNNGYGNFYGIHLYLSCGNVVANNTCSWNDQSGIYLYYSDGNTLVDNTCSNNGHGMIIDSSDGIVLTNNTCSSNSYGGIGLNGCRCNTLSQNKIIGGGISIGGGSGGSQLTYFNSHSIDATNTANGRPVYYYKNQTGITVPAGAGQIILANCTGTEIDNQNISDADIGIEVVYCAWTNITNSSCSNGYNGIDLDESDQTTIFNITSTENADGVMVYHSTNATVRSCALISNSYGVYFQYSKSFELASSVFKQNSMMLYVEECSDGRVCNNTASTTLEDYEYDFRLEYSSNVTIEGNVFGTYGLYINGYSLEHFNTHKIPPNNYLAGKPILFYANTNNVELDSVDAAQLYIVNSTQSSIRNLVLDHASIGLMIAYSDGIGVENCTVSDCKYGVSAWFCSNLSFSGCEVSDIEEGGGIGLHDSSGNTLSNNNCSNNGYGIYIYSSSNNTLRDNTCSNNWCGMYLDSSDGNGIIWNEINNNTNYGLTISSDSNDNRISNNAFAGNNGATDTYDVSHVQAYDDGLGNLWNSTDGYGNYWSDWTGPDADMNGVVDLPYNISGSAGAEDNYPLTTVQTPIPEFGMMPLVVIGLMAVILVAGEVGRKKP